MEPTTDPMDKAEESEAMVVDVPDSSSQSQTASVSTRIPEADGSVAEPSQLLPEPDQTVSTNSMEVTSENLEDTAVQDSNVETITELDSAKVENTSSDQIVDDIESQPQQDVHQYQETESVPIWTIDYDFTRTKFLLKEESVYGHRENNYLRGCKWSPDGSCLLTNSNDNKLRLFNLPQPFWTGEYAGVGGLELALTMAEGGLVYDYCWYPMMSSQDPGTCVLACTGRGLPVHLWDAFTGELRCAFKAYDHLDELISAKSIAFTRTGDKIYCGFEKAIRVFDTSRPGRECQTFSYKSTKKRQVRGQAGIMSSIAFHHDNTMFAVGTYARSVGLYSSETNKCVQILRGHACGVTQVQFLPNGNHLLSGTRKDNDIFCWDIRYARAPAFRLQRLVRTNQRMQFSTDPSGRFLASGSDDGKISFWDLNGGLGDESDILKPVFEVGAHEDTVNGVDLHPFLPVLASVSGQHQLVSLASDGDSDDSEAEDGRCENSLKLWSMGPLGTNDLVTISDS